MHVYFLVFSLEHFPSSPLLPFPSLFLFRHSEETFFPPHSFFHPLACVPLCKIKLSSHLKRCFIVHPSFSLGFMLLPIFSMFSLSVLFISLCGCLSSSLLHVFNRHSCSFPFLICWCFFFFFLTALYDTNFCVFTHLPSLSMSFSPSVTSWPQGEPQWDWASAAEQDDCLHHRIVRNGAHMQCAGTETRQAHHSAHGCFTHENSERQRQHRGWRDIQTVLPHRPGSRAWLYTSL